MVELRTPKHLGWLGLKIIAQGEWKKMPTLVSFGFGSIRFCISSGLLRYARNDMVDRWENRIFLRVDQRFRNLMGLVVFASLPLGT